MLVKKIIQISEKETTSYELFWKVIDILPNKMIESLKLSLKKTNCLNILEHENKNK